MKRITTLFLTTFALATAIACGGGGGSTSPTGPSASGPFNGTWSGTFGGSPGTPITFTLTQTGSTVTGFDVIVCSGCGDGRSNVSGTASGNVATVTFTHPGDSTPYFTGITLTLSGNSMSTQWRGDNGATITGSLTSGSAPPVTTTPPPVTSTYAVTQAATTCRQTARSDTRYGFTINQSGTVTGASNAFLDLSEVFLGISGTTLSCNSWSYSDGTCRRLGGQPETTAWSVVIVTPLGYKNPGTWTVGAAVRSSTGSLQASSSANVTCVGQ